MSIWVKVSIFFDSSHNELKPIINVINSIRGWYFCPKFFKWRWPFPMIWIVRKKKIESISFQWKVIQKNQVSIIFQICPPNPIVWHLELFHGTNSNFKGKLSTRFNSAIRNEKLNQWREIEYQNSPFVRKKWKSYYLNWNHLI